MMRNRTENQLACAQVYFLQPLGEDPVNVYVSTEKVSSSRDGPALRCQWAQPNLLRSVRVSVRGGENGAAIEWGLLPTNRAGRAETCVSSTDTEAWMSIPVPKFSAILSDAKVSILTL